MLNSTLPPCLVPTISCLYMRPTCVCIYHILRLLYIQAVVFASNLANVPPPSSSSSVVKLVLEGIKRDGCTPSTGANPMTSQLLKKLYFHVNLSERVYRVFWACSLLMFFSLLRVSHVTNSCHNLVVSDVAQHSWGLMLSIRTSKTHRNSVPVLLPVCSLADTRYCPVYWIKRLLSEINPRPGAPLFSALLGRKFTYSMFRSCLSKTTSAAGFHKKFSGHSFRKGGALYLVSLGVPLTQVQERGGWKSLCVLKYLSIPVEDRVCIERRLASKFH